MPEGGSPKSTCPACGAEVLPDARFCGSCGAAIVAASTCGSCGAAISPGARFCPACGAAGADEPVAPAPPAPESLGAPAPAATAAPVAPAAPPKSKKKTGLIVAIVVVALLLCCCCGVLAVRTPVMEVIQEVIESVEISLLGLPTVC